MIGRSETVVQKRTLAAEAVKRAVIRGTAEPVPFVELSLASAS